MTTIHTHHRVDVAAVRAAMRTFATGVTVVTTRGDGAPSGVTASAFSAVSLAPPLVLVCLSALSSTLREIEANGVFAVNVLSEEQESLSRSSRSAPTPLASRSSSTPGATAPCATAAKPPRVELVVPRVHREEVNTP